MPPPNYLAQGAPDWRLPLTHLASPLSEVFPGITPQINRLPSALLLGPASGETHLVMKNTRTQEDTPNAGGPTSCRHVAKHDFAEQVTFLSLDLKDE